jgi:hypothetical protein
LSFNLHSKTRWAAMAALYACIFKNGQAKKPPKYQIVSYIDVQKQMMKDRRWKEDVHCNDNNNRA